MPPLHITPAELLRSMKNLMRDCAQMELDAVRCWGPESVWNIPRAEIIRWHIASHAAVTGKRQSSFQGCFFFSNLIIFVLDPIYFDFNQQSI